MKTIINILFLPVKIILDLFKSHRKTGVKVGYLLLSLVIFLPIWYRGYTAGQWAIKNFLFERGLIDQITKIKVSGESMLPTVNDGSQISLHSPNKFKIERGDIVSFRNLETGSRHYLKRIIGLPNEEVVLKNGDVFINGKTLTENYTLNHLPTYGGSFLVECNSYPVPENYFLVLGDNRTVSMDSRTLGFVKKEDIDGVIKMKQSYVFADEEKKTAVPKSQINEAALLEKINQERKNASSPLLNVNVILVDSAKTRTTETSNFFTPLDKLLQTKGYRYNLAHEFATYGFLDEETILKQIMESAEDKAAFLSANFIDIGIASIEKTNKECTFPMTVIIIGWGTVPNYSQAMIDSWAKEVKDTKEWLNFLQNLVGVSSVNQEELRGLITALAESSEIASQMYQKTTSQEWVNPQLSERYAQLAKENKPKLEALVKQVKNMPGQ